MTSNSNRQPTYQELADVSAAMRQALKRYPANSLEVVEETTRILREQAQTRARQ